MVLCLFSLPEDKHTYIWMYVWMKYCRCKTRGHENCTKFLLLNCYFLLFLEFWISSYQITTLLPSIWLKCILLTFQANAVVQLIQKENRAMYVHLQSPSSLTMQHKNKLSLNTSHIKTCTSRTSSDAPLATQSFFLV